jgi:hypothetical protein
MVSSTHTTPNYRRSPYAEAPVGRRGLPGADGRRLLRASGVAFVGRPGAALHGALPLEGPRDDGRDRLQPEASLAFRYLRIPGITCTFMGPQPGGRRNITRSNTTEKSDCLSRQLTNRWLPLRSRYESTVTTILKHMGRGINLLLDSTSIDTCLNILMLSRVPHGWAL